MIWDSVDEALGGVEQVELEFKPGDRVRLTRGAVNFYGGTWPHWVPEAQGGGSAGTVLFAGERPHKLGAAPRPYFVRWDSGAENSYRVEDLEAASGNEVTLEPQEEQAIPKIVPFQPRRKP